jgi:hypothetical protein
MSFNSPNDPRSSKSRSLEDLHQGDENNENSQEDFGLDLVDELTEHSEHPANRPVKKWMLVAGMLAILIVGAIVLISVMSPKDTTTDVVNAKDAQTSTQEISGGGIVNVVISQSADGIAVQATDLPPAPEGFDYQWYTTAKDGSIRRVAVLKDDNTGQWVAVSDLDRVDDLTLSLETDEGLDVPEGEPIAIVDTP